MKNFLKITAVALAIIFSFTHCCRNKLTDETYFYMNESTDQGPLKLYLDGEYKGELPFINTGGNDGHYDLIKHAGLFMTIKTSSFKVEARNAQGNIVTSASFKRSPRAITAGECTGPTELTQTPDFVIIALKFTPGMQ